MIVLAPARAKYFTLKAGTVLEPYNAYDHELMTVPADVCLSATWRLSADEDSGGSLYYLRVFEVVDEHGITGEEENSLRGAVYNWARNARQLRRDSSGGGA